MKNKTSITAIAILSLSNIYFCYKWVSLNNSINRSANDLLVYSVTEPLKLTIYSYLTLSDKGKEEGMSLLSQYIQVLKKDVPEENDRMSAEARKKLRRINELIVEFDRKHESHNE